MTDGYPFHSHVPHLVEGLVVTLVVWTGAALLMLVCALLAGLGRQSRDLVVRGVATIYVEVFRGTSALVQLYWFYFALPLLTGIELDALVVGIVVLGMNAGAYGGEIVRGALQAVPEGQRRAALALNLSRGQTLRFILLPQAIPAMLPPLGNLLIELLKGTALVSMITVTDLTRAGLNIRDNTLQTTEIFVTLLGIYFLLSLGISAVMRRIEKLANRHVLHEEIGAGV
jgi:polar amino acid transport system permease protein